MNQQNPQVPYYIYVKPDYYNKFLTELISACKKGNEDSKQLMKKLVPILVKSLKKEKEWDSPKHCFKISEKLIPLISNEKEYNEIDDINGIYDYLISANLDPSGSGTDEESTDEESNDETNNESNQESEGITSSCDVPNASTELENDANEAICNLLTDT